MEIILVQIQGQKNPKSPHPPHAPPGKLSATIGVDRGYPAPDTWHHATPHLPWQGGLPFYLKRRAGLIENLKTKRKSDHHWIIWSGLSSTPILDTLHTPLARGAIWRRKAKKEELEMIDDLIGVKSCTRDTTTTLPTSYWPVGQAKKEFGHLSCQLCSKQN